MEHSILASSIRALLMALATVVVVSALRIRAAALLHRAWAATTAAMLLLPLWIAWGPSVIAPVLPPAPERPAMQFLARASTQVGIRGTGPAALPEPSRTTLATPLPPARMLRPDWPSILLAIYLTGFSAMLARLIWGTLSVVSLIRSARREGKFRVSSRCAAPITVGWFRPVAVLPECWRTWSPAKLETVLLHENEHARRRDPLVQWLALFNRCVFWFHPLAWWLERKLATLAEDACDAAVLASGCAPQDYARRLIELARSVSESRTRIRCSGAVAFSAGSLPRRIRRIMDAPPVGPHSRTKSVASAGLCAVLLSVCLACSLGRQQGAPSKALSMTEQQRREQAVSMERRQRAQMEESLLQDAVLGMTPSRAKIREAELRANPTQEYKARELVRYYESIKDWASLNALTLWFIAEHPDLRESWGARPPWDAVWEAGGYTRARQLWMEQLNKPGHGPYFYMNAGGYLSGSDNEQAEQIFLEGRRRFPSAALHWEIFLARHYAWALAGMPGPLPAGRNVIPFGDRETALRPLNQGPYVTKVREILQMSKDTELLDRTVEQLQFSAAGTEFAQSLIDRVLSIEPDNRSAHLRHDNLQQKAAILHAMKGSETLSDSDRMIYLSMQLSRMPQTQDREAKAQELLALAARNPKDRNYGTAIFVANLELGDAALERGDKAGAVRDLHAAAEAPPTEFLRYNHINMALPRRLVDVGERKAVADFLDRCAKFNDGGLPLARWAEEIRDGKNPRLSPDLDRFRQGR